MIGIASSRWIESAAEKGDRTLLPERPSGGFAQNGPVLFFRHRRAVRAGLTLVEMLVVVAVTLIFMFALTQVFALLGDGITSGRALIELNGQMRAITLRLQSDLDSITVPVIPWETLQNGGGYMEIVEGRATDKNTDADLELTTLWDTNDDGVQDPDERAFGILDPSDPIRTQHDIDQWDQPPVDGIRNSGEPFFDTRIGDNDDVIMFTARSYDVPFVGKFVRDNGESVTIESNLAEIIWWTQFTPEFDDVNRNGVYDFGETKTLYRRVLLISPILSNPPLGAGPTKPDLSQAALTSKNEFIFGGDYNGMPTAGSDISVRIGDTGLVPNTLADLTKRENRVARIAQNPSDFPFEFDPTLLDRLVGPRQGDDVVLTRVLAFDARVYDPFAPLVVAGDQLLSPSDPDWNPEINTIASRGAYVDLNYAGNATVSLDQGFSGPRRFKAGKGNLNQAMYCTWSFHYEHDGVNNHYPDETSGADQGTNGLDDDGFNGVDDPGERETSPPYPVPLRGMQLRIRVYEPDSQTVRQSTVTTTFSQ